MEQLARSVFSHVNWAVGGEDQSKQRTEKSCEKCGQAITKGFQTWGKGNSSPPLLQQLQKLLGILWEVKWPGWGQSQGQGSFPLCRKVTFPGLEAHSPLGPSPWKHPWGVDHPGPSPSVQLPGQGCFVSGPHRPLPVELVQDGSGVDKPLFERGPFQLKSTLILLLPPQRGLQVGVGLPRGQAGDG